MYKIRLISSVCAFFAALLLPASSFASPAAPVAAVLHQEARWLTAIENGDAKTIGAILSENFKHITYRGKLLDRAQELASVAKEPFTMHATEQTVDFAGDAAVVHGLNTLSRSGKVVMRQRYTDVYVKRNAVWLAWSSQETEIAP
jgi:ketosteroid isomerase-like protein